MSPPLAFYGTIIHSKSVNELQILENTLLIVDDAGTIVYVEPNVPNEKAIVQKFNPWLSGLSEPPSSIQMLKGTEFLIPGLCDTHNHAPQFHQRGLGQGMQILDWLNQITFKNEARFVDTKHAEQVYDKCVQAFLRQGITSAAYYGSLHGPATKILADTCLRHGQRALIGKCNMDRNSPSFYIEPSAEASLKATEEVIAHVQKIDSAGEIVRPVLTPRFAISCTDALLVGLGELAKKHPTIPIQTHFNEAQSEIDATLPLFPQFKSEVDLYSHFNLLTPRTILAHCCLMTSAEIEGLKRLDCGIAHCPIANTTVGGGFMGAPIRAFLDEGIQKIGLGTDSGGGFSLSILDAMRQAFIVSNYREVISNGKEKALSMDEAFWMATVGGAMVMNIHDKVGKLEVGKQFDAILVRSGEAIEIEAKRAKKWIDPGVMTPVIEEDDKRAIFSKFIMTADDRNISKVWVKGRLVKD